MGRGRRAKHTIIVTRALYVNMYINVSGTDILLSFSIIRTWSRLQQNDYRIKQPVERLKGMDGIR